MSIGQLPSYIEKGIEQFARQNHLSHEEAVIKLLESGLRHGQPTPKIKGLSGEPMTDEDAAIVDGALELVMQARRQRSDRLNP